MEINQQQNRFDILRHRAETVLGESLTAKPLAVEDKLTKLIRELELYQIELHMQSDEISASQTALENEQAKFAGFYHAAPVGYVILDHQGTIQEVNTKGITLLSKTTKVLQGHTFALCIHPDSREAYLKFLDACKHKPEGAHTEVMLHMRNKELCVVMLHGSWSVHPVTRRDTYYITIGDITSTKLEEQRQTEMAERLALSLEASGSGIWKTSACHQFIYLDEHAKRLLGIDSLQDHFRIHELSAVFVAEDSAKFQQYATSPDPDMEIDMELQRLPVRRKSKYIALKGRSIKELNGNSYLTGILMDITERKKSLAIEEERRKVQQLLLQKAAVEAQEREREKISAILHDSVCQILYAIRYSLNVLKQDGPLPKELAEMYELLEQAISELRTLSANISPTILKDFGLVAGMQDTVRRLKNIGFHIHADIDLAADRLPKDIQIYIFRIVQELINNSIKHSGTNAATVSIQKQDNYVSVQVQDEGKGFGDDLEEAIKQGSGIRGISNRVALLNGSFEILTDAGTQFKVVLPLNPQETFLYEQEASV
ncbi:PAS domain-containing sensor histidine kinase [Sphingobacterium paludis]|uniref:PAS domain S-box-containing protein n=1 Tax=Sphingobacterium paludis TaxID=1476465 RepID=A0A4R7CZ59_9SPHI|nr:PAS domain S-box protein [Sphingobacterium paludis]TDS13192.1 PAS domain S-box-containing protein [Sphingobacterium paludis]